MLPSFICKLHRRSQTGTTEAFTPRSIREIQEASHLTLGCFLLPCRPLVLAGFAGLCEAICRSDQEALIAESPSAAI